MLPFSIPVEIQSIETKRRQIVQLANQILSFKILLIMTMSLILTAENCSAAKTELTVHLQANNGQYIVAEGGGGGPVKANRNSASIWETFTLEDINGGQLLSGDKVHFKTYKGHYLVAEGGGGREVKADRTAAGVWETFTIAKASGGGPILHGDAVTLLAHNGQYVVAEGGGGGAVNANRDKAHSWETFKLFLDFSSEYSGVKRSKGTRPLLVILLGPDDPSWHPHLNIYTRKTDGYIYLNTIQSPKSDPKKVNLRAHSGQYVVAEGGGGGAVNADRQAAHSWETFTLEDVNGGQLVSGDKIHLKTHNGHYLVAEGGGGREVKADRTAADIWETFTIAKASGTGRILHGDAVTLRAHNGQYVVAEGGGGGVVNANRQKAYSWETFILEQHPGSSVQNIALPKTKQFQSAPTTVNSPEGSLQSVFALGDDGYIYQTFTSVFDEDDKWKPWVKLPGTTKFQSTPTALNTPDGKLLSVMATGQDGYVYQILYARGPGSHWQSKWSKLPGTTKFQSAPTSFNTPDGKLLSVMATGQDGYVYQILYARGPGSHWQSKWSKLPGTTKFQSAPTSFNTPDGKLLSVMATGQDGYVYQILYARGPGSHWQSKWSKLPGTTKFQSAPTSFNTPDGKLLSVMATGQDGYVYQILYARGPGSHWQSKWSKLPGTEKFISAPWSMNSADGNLALVYALGDDHRLYTLVFIRGAGSRWWSRWAPVPGNNNVHASGATAVPRLAPKRTPQHYEDLLFSTTQGVRGYYLENSYQKFTFKKAMITPWLKPEDDPSTKLDESSFDYLHWFDGKPGALQRKSNWIVEQVEKLTSFRFANYDRNHDGKVSHDELAMLWIYPGFGDARGRGFNPAVVKVSSLSGPSQGVQLGLLVRGGATTSMETIAHELGHQTLGLPDLYPGGGYPGVGQFSLMAAEGSDTHTYRWAKHLDPWAKIKLGWLAPKVITQDGSYTFKAVEKNPDAYIIYNPNRGTKEYFIIENRWPTGSFEYRLPDKGLAIWHIDESHENQSHWGRKTIRLVSPLGNTPALWDSADPTTGYDLTPTSNPTNTNWNDGTASGVSIKQITVSGSSATINVDVPY